MNNIYGVSRSVYLPKVHAGKYKVYNDINEKTKPSDDSPAMEKINSEIYNEYKNLESKNFVKSKDLKKFFNGLSLKDQKNFIKITMKAGDEGQAIVETAISLSAKDLNNFLDFSGSLNAVNLQNFSKALDHSPEQLHEIMEIASKLSKKNLKNYFSAAARAEDRLDLLNKEVESLFTGANETNNMRLKEFLSAAEKSGGYVDIFLNKIQDISPEHRNKIIDYINQGVSEEEYDSFFSILAQNDEDTVARILDIASNLSNSDRSKLMETAADAGKSLNSFLSKTENLSGVNLSNFIKSANNSLGKLQSFLSLSGELDLSFTKDLSRVDMANFLKIAENRDIDLEKVMETSLNLSGQDKSYMLYAVGHVVENHEEFFNKLADISDADLSEFLKKEANNGSEKSEPAVYMKGLLGEKGYENFKKAASYLSDNEIKDMEDLINDLDNDERVSFLDIASEADNKTRDFLMISKDPMLSPLERKNFFKMGEGLYEENLKNLIQGAKSSIEAEEADSFSKFIDISQGLSGSEKEYFLRAAGNSSSKNLNGFYDMVTKLKGEEQYSFLYAADRAGDRLDGLVDMGNAILLNENRCNKFAEIFKLSFYSQTEGVFDTFIDCFC